MVSRVPTIGIIANPVSARDIRRVVANANNLQIADRVNIVLQVLASAGSCRVGRVLMMPDKGGICAMLSRRLERERSLNHHFPEVEFLDLDVNSTVEDTFVAAQKMRAAVTVALEPAPEGLELAPCGVRTGGEHQPARPVVPRRLQLQRDAAVAGQPQALLREGRTQDIAGEPLQPRPVVRRHPHVDCRSVGFRSSRRYRRKALAKTRDAVPPSSPLEASAPAESCSGAVQLAAWSRTSRARATFRCNEVWLDDMSLCQRR